MSLFNSKACYGVSELVEEVAPFVDIVMTACLLRVVRTFVRLCALSCHCCGPQTCPLIGLVTMEIGRACVLVYTMGL